MTLVIGGGVRRWAVFAAIAVLELGGTSQAGRMGRQGGSAPRMERAPEEPPRPAGKLDLRLKGGPAGLGIEGTWVYEPVSGGPSYDIAIKKTEGGFYQYEGRRKDAPRPVLQCDRAQEGTLYRGQIGEGFDDCIPAGARFSLFPTGDTIVFEPALPVEAPVHHPPPGPCTDAARYFLAARGRGEEVRLHAQSELAGAAAAPDARSEPTGNRPGSGRASENAPAANISIGMPTVPDGTQVLLLGSVRDGNSKVWHHVKLLVPLEPPGAGKPSRKSQEKDKGRDGGPSADRGNDPGSPTSANDGADTHRRDEGASHERDSDPRGATGSKDAGVAAVRPKQAAEPPSGYVAAANLVVRWECRLVRVGTGGAGPASEARP